MCINGAPVVHVSGMRQLLANTTANRDFIRPAMLCYSELRQQRIKASSRIRSLRPDKKSEYLRGSDRIQAGGDQSSKQMLEPKLYSKW